MVQARARVVADHEQVAGSGDDVVFGRGRVDGRDRVDLDADGRGRRDGDPSIDDVIRALVEHDKLGLPHDDARPVARAAGVDLPVRHEHGACGVVARAVPNAAARIDPRRERDAARRRAARVRLLVGVADDWVGREVDRHDAAAVYPAVERLRAGVDAAGVTEHQQLVAEHSESVRTANRRAVHDGRRDDVEAVALANRADFGEHAVLELEQLAGRDEFRVGLGVDALPELEREQLLTQRHAAPRAERASGPVGRA